ncbi:MAG TPA: TonB-dependent receptor, partial [Verrucomicrobiae bacterium]|nr:TonB-dependent receptor [Verrucomicrobiae bacterium]
MLAALAAPCAQAQSIDNPSLTNSISIAGIQGGAEVLAKGATNWEKAHAGQILYPLDRLRAGSGSRVTLHWSDQSIVSLDAVTALEILPPDHPGDQAGLHLIRGMVSFFHRDQPGHINCILPGAAAGVDGTEFVMAVDETDASTLSVIEGKVHLGNAQATLVLTNGEQAVVVPGGAPKRTAGFIANNLLQWCFYYPAVVDPDELQLSEGEQKDLAGSLASYRTGDLPAALAQYPAGRTGASDPEKIYHAALLLSVGEAGEAETTLSGISDKSGASKKLGDALRQLMAAVKRQPSAATDKPELTAELMAGSYFEQSLAIRETSLRKALELARKATVKSPNFGFAWERTAELEFSFGETKPALRDLDRSLVLSPHNAQALALKGFILAAQNEPKKAREWFDRAIAADAGLGNAWLGRGLTRIHLGDKSGGRKDLLVAAALEPQRAELRSYLGKAYAYVGDDAHARKELALAKKLDPNDPTAWLYSALFNQQGNQINDAIRDLEKSQSLNDNRSVYRSQLLLDEDSAVRSANLARIYQDAGMAEVSIDEAGRAVNYDYANYAAHNFLGNSYYGAIQPGQNNSRYETAAQSESLITELLAPASAGIFSSIMSQPLRFNAFEQNRIGVISSTEYLSRGAWNESALQYGTYDNFSYGLEGDYLSDPGQRGNNRVEDKALRLMLKFQVTPADSVYAEVDDRRIESGDLGQYYDPSMANPTTSIDEKQAPDLVLGYHHEWSPGVQTLFLASRTEADTSLTGTVPFIMATRSANLTTDPLELNSVVGGLSLNDAYDNQLTLYTAELQQIFEQGNHTTILGGRFQYGSFDTTNFESHASAFPDEFLNNMYRQKLDSTLKRFSFYGYHTWQIAEPLELIGGLSYDWMEYPASLFYLPVSAQSQKDSQLSPKAGLIWTPTKDTTLRFAYTRSLGGQNLDQSERIEPTQVAGFLQTFRTIIGEPGVAQNGAARDETFGFSLEQKFATGTYVQLSGEMLRSKIGESVGVFESLPDELDYATNSTLHENLDYEEKSLQLTVNQLLGRDWV